MVGTIAPFEAMLRVDPKVETTEDEAFVARAASFLVGRELRLGSASELNAEERPREPTWRQLCFPRFDFYDVLRGLHALARWLARGGAIAARAIEDVVTQLCQSFPDGVVAPAASRSPASMLPNSDQRDPRSTGYSVATSSSRRPRRPRQRRR